MEAIKEKLELHDPVLVDENVAKALSRITNIAGGIKGVGTASAVVVSKFPMSAYGCCVYVSLLGTIPFKVGASHPLVVVGSVEELASLLGLLPLPFT